MSPEADLFIDERIPGAVRASHEEFCFHQVDMSLDGE